MNLLLDTHIWLWSVLEPQRLTRRVAGELTSAKNQLWLSPVSVWELHLLVRRKRIELDEQLESWVRKTLENLQLNEAPFTVDVALAVAELNLPHSDPADQFLIASARIFGLTLVTADELLLRTAGVQTLANR